MSTVREYFAGLEEPARDAFTRILSLAIEVAPDAEEGSSYGIAALRYRGKPLLGFRAADQHLSVFPFSPHVIEAVRDRLAGFDVSKGTIRFTAERPLRDGVVRDLVRLRAEEIHGGAHRRASS